MNFCVDVPPTARKALLSCCRRSQPVGAIRADCEVCPTGGSRPMDDVVNRFARELADSIAAAVSESAEVEACRERARAAGYEMKVNLEAVVGFVNRGQPQTDGTDAAGKAVPTSKALVPRKPFDMTVNDRRFLRSLR